MILLSYSASGLFGNNYTYPNAYQGYYDFGHEDEMEVKLSLGQNVLFLFLIF